MSLAQASLTGRPDPSKKTKKIVSAGGAVLDKDNHVLILKRRVEGTWVLPKGRMEEGETLEETALREVREETGLAQLKVEREIGMVRYVFFWRPEEVNYKKTVHYFLMRLEDGSEISLEPDFIEHRWVNHGEAIKTLTFENDRRIIRGMRNH